jgi:hypothetical protein
MPRYSKYRDGVRHQLNEAQAAFENWLAERGYEPAPAGIPWAVEATALVDDFLDDCPEYEQQQKTVKRHAAAIGSVSDCDPEDELLPDEES